MKSPVDMKEDELRSKFDFSQANRGRFREQYSKGYSVAFLDRDPDSVKSISKPDNTREAGSRILESRIRKAGYSLGSPLPGDKVDYRVYGSESSLPNGRSCGIKVTSSSSETFKLYSAWKSIPRAIFAYVWHAHDPNESDVYALTYSEAFDIIRRKGYANTLAWRDLGGYSVTHAGKELTEMLAKYRMTDERLRTILQGI